MGGILDIVGDLIASAVEMFLFMTGEVLLWMGTLGRHRIRWWEVQDINVTWPITLLGLAFWLGVGGLITLVLR